MKLYKEQIMNMQKSKSFGGIFDKYGCGYSKRKAQIKMAKYVMGFCILFPTICTVAIPLFIVSSIHGALIFAARFICDACDECEFGVRLLWRLRKTDLKNLESINKPAN